MIVQPAPVPSAGADCIKRERKEFATMSKKESLIRYKLLYTIIILVVYLLGRELPLYGIDTSQYLKPSMDAQDLLMQAIGGDRYRYSLFALGISPYMISSILAQIIVAGKKISSKTRISRRKTNVLTAVFAFIIALLQALLHVRKLSFSLCGEAFYLAQAVAVTEMVTGAMLIIWLAARNKKYGIGGQTALILVNIVDSLVSMVKGYDIELLSMPLLISAAAMLLIIFMESSEKRISVQRISIHNVYADKNYLAVKLNPIGIMPVFFSTAFFSLPQLLIQGLVYFFPENAMLAWLQENLVLTMPVGIGVYIGILYLLTIVFSMVFVSPGELAEQFLKNGDSLLNVHAGRDTKKYLRRTVLKLSFLSATVMGICLGVPLCLQLQGNLDTALVMVPTLVIMLTGICCNLYQEIVAVKSFDVYKPFW